MLPHEQLNPSSVSESMCCSSPCRWAKLAQHVHRKDDFMVRRQVECKSVCRVCRRCRISRRCVTPMLSFDLWSEPVTEMPERKDASRTGLAMRAGSSFPPCHTSSVRCETTSRSVLVLESSFRCRFVDGVSTLQPWSLASKGFFCAGLGKLVAPSVRSTMAASP